ncbi:MAG TPA: glycosyltransferase family 2 protein [Pseudorhizobium sp.]|nr:glycosyltransferase family 2 protein [Pseudorhizobium sp.]
MSHGSRIREDVLTEKPAWDTGAPSISVVIPTLNEAMNLPHVLPRIPSWISEVILVDGNSKDGTVDVARKLIPSIRVINEARKGKGRALRTGVESSSGSIVITLDADGSADPAEIPVFVGALLAGADFVKGSRFMQGGGTSDMEWHRKLGNWGFVTLVKWRFGSRFTDLCYGYNAFWKDIWPVLVSDDADGFEIETSMNLRALVAKLNVHEVPSMEYRRIHGTSNLNAFSDGLRVLRTITKFALGAGGNQAALPQLERRRQALPLYVGNVPNSLKSS